MTSNVSSRQASDFCAAAAALLDLLDAALDRGLPPIHWTLTVDSLNGGAVLAGSVVGAGAGAAERVFAEWCDAADMSPKSIVRPGDYPEPHGGSGLVAVAEKPGSVTLILEASTC